MHTKHTRIDKKRCLQRFSNDLCWCIPHVININYIWCCTSMVFTRIKMTMIYALTHPIRLWIRQGTDLWYSPSESGALLSKSCYTHSSLGQTCQTFPAKYEFFHFSKTSIGSLVTFSCSLTSSLQRSMAASC